MQNNDSAKVSREGLSMDERYTLEHRVLPAAKEWVRKYPMHSSMWNHGMNTLQYWNEL